MTKRVFLLSCALAWPAWASAQGVQLQAGSTATSPAVAPSAQAPSPAASAATTAPQAPVASAANAPVTAGVAAPSPARVLTLNEALATARDHQPVLHQARAAIDVSRARVGQAAAGLYPQVTGTAAYQLKTLNVVPGQFTAGSSGGIPTSVLQTLVPGYMPPKPAAPGTLYNFFNFGLNVNQLVYDFGQTWKRKEAAKVTVEARKSDEAATALQVEQNVRVAFFNARADKAMIAVAHETLDNQERHLHQIEGFVRAGARAEIDLAQVRTDYANARVTVINAENNYASDKATLNQAMGVERDTDYDVSDDGLPPIAGEDGPLDPLVKQALSRRPEFLSLQQQLRAQELTLGSIRGAYWPTLGVSTGVTEGGRQFNNLAWNWNAGATINWPIFQGGLTDAQADEARATAASLRAQVEILEQQTRVDVEQARLAVRATKAVLVASDEVVRNARERLRLAEGRYAAGIGNGIELADAQLQITSALAQRVQAEYNLAAARAQLLQALGQH